MAMLTCGQKKFLFFLEGGGCYYYLGIFINIVFSFSCKLIVENKFSAFRSIAESYCL